MADPDMSKANEQCVGPQSEAAGVAESCKGCPNAQLCASGEGRKEDTEANNAIKDRMGHIKHRVLVLSGKGGVGKSTLTKELGIMLGRMGYQVGLMDTDICGPSLPRITGSLNEEVHNSNDGWEPVGIDDNVSVISIQFLLSTKDEAVVFRGPRKNGVIKNFVKDVAWGDLDVLLVDTPPGTSDEHMSIVSFFQQSGGCDGAIVVTTPQEVAIADVRRELNFCRRSEVPILGVVENMSGFVCPSCKGESEIFPAKPGNLTAGHRLAEEFGVPFLGKVPLDPNLMMSCEVGEPLSDHILANAKEKGVEPAPSKALEALQAVAKNLLTRLGETGQTPIQAD